MNQVRTRTIKVSAPLAEGQIWTFKDQRLEVKHVGKYLVEFMLTRKQIPMPVQRHIRASKQLESIPTVLKFLHAQKAVLRRHR
jgi:hypothetical protein